MFDQVLVGEEIKRWTHYSRQADMCMFTVRLVASPHLPPAPPGQDSFELKSSNQPLKQAAKSASSRIR